MASGSKRKGGVVSLHSFVIPWSPTGSYGLKFSGTAPVFVSHVSPGSSAEGAKVKVGDLIATVNDHDVLYGSHEEVHTIIKYSQGSAISLYVGRPYPIAITETERKKALIALQSKLASVEEPADKDVESYKATIDTAFREVQDILGSFGVEQGMDQVVPDTKPVVHETELAYYDSDSLSSPPPSNEEVGEVDRLLDFSADDEFTHTPGKPQILNQIEAERALRGMKGIMEGLRDQRIEKVDASAKQREKGLVSSETTVVPSFAAREKPSIRNIQPPTKSPERKPYAPQPTQLPKEPPSRKRGSKEPTPTRAKSRSPPPPAPPRHETPPSVPPYNPRNGVDTFLLSNKPEYQEEWRKHTHMYETVDREEVARYRSQSPPQSTDVPATETKSPVRKPKSPQHKAEAAPAGVPLRMKAKSPDRLPVTERGGYIADPGRKHKFAPQQPSTAGKLTDIHDLSVACGGLPTSVYEWRCEEVGVWLKQLSPSLYELYFSFFSKHDITGRTLMRLNDSKLKTIGIQDPKHRRLLASTVTKLKIRQEGMELRDLEKKVESSFI